MSIRPSLALEFKRERAASGWLTRASSVAAHGTDRDGSDLDRLVEALSGATLFDLGGLHDELEALLGVHVDLLIPAELPPKFQSRVFAEARRDEREPFA